LDAANGPDDTCPSMNILLAIDQLSAEWMSSNGKTAKAAAGETVSRGSKNERAG
jgi:hypothetical protein